MDEHGVASDRAQAGTHRVRTLGAALDEFADVQTVERAGRVAVLSLPDHDPNRVDRRVPQQ